MCVSVAGLPAEKLVEAHGSFSTATCTLCKQKYDGEDIKVHFTCAILMVSQFKFDFEIDKCSDSMNEIHAVCFNTNPNVHALMTLTV